MATTDLKLEEPGSLPRPGPVGRLVRLVFGGACLWYVYALIQLAGNPMTADGSIHPVIINGIIVGLFLVSYIINIGYSRAWKKWPAFASLLIFAVLAMFGYLVAGTMETELLARMVWLWELYLFSHLGLAFVVAASIGTPGCEMSAFHDLYSRVSGVPTGEHHCPVGPLHPIDQWEAARSK